MSLVCAGADTHRMIWPVAALAVFVLGFVVVYGSLVQSRLDIGRGRNDYVERAGTSPAERR